jgi:hypothetical protein
METKYKSIYHIQKIVETQQQIKTTRDTLILQERDIHVNTGKTPESITMKKKIIVGILAGIHIMMEVHGVLHLVVGIGVTCRYVALRTIYSDPHI